MAGQPEIIPDAIVQPECGSLEGLYTSEEHLEHIACPLCGADDPRGWGNEAGFQAVRCGECGLVYVNPRPSAKTIAAAITLGQHQTETGVLDVKARRQRSRVSALRRVVRDMYHDALESARPLSWLDVGAGYGEFVEALLTTLPRGSDVLGIEPMHHKVDAAHNLGLPLKNLYLSEVNDTYDVISIMNVFSHVPDFGAFLMDLKKKLSTSGEVFIQTGNGGDLCDRSEYPDPLYLPDHLVFAGEKHIEQFIDRAGFKLVSKRRFRVDTPYHAAKNVAKRLLGRPSWIVPPYTSRFRTVYFRARAI